LFIVPAVALAAALAGCGKTDESSGTGGADTEISAGADSGVSASTSTNEVSASASASTASADNTGINKRDRAEEALTPGDQANNDADRELTRKIRRTLTSNDQLSMTAKNIKIIAVDGKVTLRGPVKTAEEREQIAALAQLASGGVVNNQLEVKQTAEEKN
jgi:osmotically-inducible protein OsmY